MKHETKYVYEWNLKQGHALSLINSDEHIFFNNEEASYFLKSDIAKSVLNLKPQKVKNTSAIADGTVIRDRVILADTKKYLTDHHITELGKNGKVK